MTEVLEYPNTGEDDESQDARAEEARPADGRASRSLPREAARAIPEPRPAPVGKEVPF